MAKKKTKIKEPKDKYSDEWYDWKNAKLTKGYVTKGLSKFQDGLTGRKKMDKLAELEGATIINVGFHSNIREGGLGIDYVKNGVKKRMLFGYNELGFHRGTFFLYRSQNRQRRVF